MNLIVTVKHYYRNPEEPRKIIFDYDQDFIFSYDMKTLSINGSGWKKEVQPEDVADTIRMYFETSNYKIANIQKQLD